MGLGETITREELLSRLQAAESEEEFDALVAAGRPLLDYAFFQNLTSSIESASNAESAAQLKALRTKILDTTTKQDEATRARIQRAGELLRAILEASDPQAVARQRLDEIDDTFFAVLSANLQRASAEKREDIVQALRQVGDMVVSLMEDRLPPEVRLVNRLLNASYPDGTEQLLRAQRELLTPEFIAGLDQVADELEQSGDEELAGHMRQVRDQARLVGQGVLQT
jgi:hypothetical protein